MTGRNLGVPIDDYLRRICRKSMTAQGCDEVAAAERCASTGLIALTG